MFEANTTLNENSTNTPLTGGATFTGIWTDVDMHDTVMIAVKTDQSGTLYADFSPDASNVDFTLTYNIEAGTSEVHRLAISRKYFRIRYVNDSVAQTYMRLQTIAGRQGNLSSWKVVFDLASQFDNTTRR